MKKIIITGGSSGLGNETAGKIASYGDLVVFILSRPSDMIVNELVVSKEIM